MNVRKRQWLRIALALGWILGSVVWLVSLTSGEQYIWNLQPPEKWAFQLGAVIMLTFPLGSIVWVLVGGIFSACSICAPIGKDAEMFVVLTAVLAAGFAQWFFLVPSLIHWIHARRERSAGAERG